MRRLAAALLVSATLMLCSCSPAPDTDLSGLDELAASEQEMKLVAECLRDRGWPVEWRDGAIGIELPEEQRTAYEADTDECFVEAGVDTSAELSEDDFQLLYAWHVEIADCLEAAGWPAQPRPSYEVFRSTYETEPWIPWSVVEGSDYDEAARACPVLNAQN